MATKNLPSGYGRMNHSQRSLYWARRRVARARSKLNATKKANQNPLYNPLSPLTGAKLKQVVNSEVGLQLNPQLSAMDRQANSVRLQNQALSQRVGDYYKQIAEAAAKDQARQDAINQTLKTDTASVGDRARAALGTASDQATQAAQADAALRGSGLSGGGQDQVQGELAAEKARAASQGASSEQRAADIGAMGSTLMNELAAARASRGGEVQGELSVQEANKLNDIATQRALLEAQRGPMTLKALQDERQKQFDNLVAMKTLGVREDQVNAQAAQAAGNLALANRKLGAAIRHNRNLEKQGRSRIRLQANSPSRQIDQAKINFFNKHGYWPPTGPPKDKAGKPAFTQTQVRSNHAKLDNVMALARGAIGAGKLKKGGVQQFAAAYANEKNGDPLLARVAADLALNGDVDPKYAKLFFDRYGVRVRARRPKKPPINAHVPNYLQFGPQGL